MGGDLIRSRESNRGLTFQVSLIEYSHRNSMKVVYRIRLEWHGLLQKVLFSRK